jgi:integrase
MATLDGLERISPGRNVQLTPYITASNSRFLAAGPGLTTSNDVRGGVDGKVILKDALTFDFTANPDFSQVESDDPQVTVNQRYEVYFPEKRPFFLDNSSYFSTPVNLFYSQRVVDPNAGAHLSGKVGPWTLGFLATDDRAPGQSVDNSDRLHGGLTPIGVARVWLGMWREGERHRTKTLGQKSEMTKAAARAELDRILEPINAKEEAHSANTKFGVFLRDVFYPFCRRKWKRSTRMTSEQRINQHIVPELEGLELRSIDRVGLQELLDRKAAAGVSFGVVNHLRFDLRQIFKVAVADGFIGRNPAQLLFTPQSAQRGIRRMADLEQIARALAVMNLRERLILKLAGIAGMRPGEIFALKWATLEPPYADVRQRVYHGVIDSPKSPKSMRRAALSDSVVADIALWRAMCPTAPDGWVFPSETIKTPLRPGNCRRRHIGPKLRAVGLEWINFQVLRRSCSSLMNDEGIDPKVISDQLGHTLDVGLNVYTYVGFERKLEAVNKLDSRLQVN